MKLCPFCAEEIQDAAIKCKHCGSMLAGPGSSPPPFGNSDAARDALPWYFKPGMLVVAFLFVGPLMLPLLWLNPHVTRRNKLIWTVVITVVSVALIVATVKAVRILIEYYRMMGF